MHYTEWIQGIRFHVKLLPGSYSALRCTEFNYYQILYFLAACFDVAIGEEDPPTKDQLQCLSDIPNLITQYSIACTIVDPVDVSFTKLLNLSPQRVSSLNFTDITA